MNEAVVIGAGWAGLSAAVELAESGFKVTVLEQSGRLGGRASSFRYEKTDDTVDSGQHLFMGCYLHTLEFLQKIGSLQKIQFQKNLCVDFLDIQGQASSLQCLPLPSPFHLFSGLFRMNKLSFREKLMMAKVYHEVKHWKGNGSLKNLTVDQWLSKAGQSERARRYFWEPITIATLNEHMQVAEADSLALVLKEAFFSTKEKSQIGISTVGLSDLCGPAEDFLRNRSGQVLKNQLVSQIVVENDSVQKLVLRDGKELSADVYVSAVPYFILPRLLGAEPMASSFFSRIRELSSSPIFSIALWFDREFIHKPFVGLLDTAVQWVFNKTRIFCLAGPGSYLSLVISGARQYLEVSDQDLLQLALTELEKCFPESRQANLKHWLIQREKNATLSPKVGFSEFRPSQKTGLKNFYLCGDWTDTGFPATIESAVSSGVKVREAL